MLIVMGPHGPNTQWAIQNMAGRWLVSKSWTVRPHTTFLWHADWIKYWGLLCHWWYLLLGGAKAIKCNQLVTFNSDGEDFSPLHQLKKQSFPTVTKRHAPKKRCCNVASASSWAIWCRSHLGTIIPSGYMPSLVRLGCPNASRAASKFRRSSYVHVQCFGMLGTFKQLVMEYSHFLSCCHEGIK